MGASDVGRRTPLSYRGIVMNSPDEFDRFYVASRDRLLLEAYALTGDLPAARTAVRDGFVLAWHHWRTVRRSGDPEDWVRPHVHGRAGRRHSARPWHREKDLDPEAAATLEALSRLTGQQRRVLVLTHLSPLPMAAIARHVGSPRSLAERELQTATARFALQREVPSTSIRGHLDHLGVVTEEVRWNRAPAVRRTGTARRRTHALVGTGIVVLALLGSGALVSGGPSRATGFDREQTTTRATARPPAPPAEPALESDALLAASQVRRLGPDLEWTTPRTDANLRGSGLVVPCQQERFADPRGLAALVRHFTGRSARGDVRARGAEIVELSRSPRVARKAYARTRGWYAGCEAERVQLVSTHRVAGVGDEATLLLLRSWGAQPRTVAVGLARSGALTVTTAAMLPAGGVAPDRVASTLAASVNRLCGAEGSGACAGPPTQRTVAPYPTGQAPGMLAAVDLPPVTRAVGPWVGTPPERASVNVAATRCDNTSFAGPGLSSSYTRTFLFPANRRADAFGLTQTVARTASSARAQAFVAEVRKRISACSEANLGTDVETVVQTRTPAREVSLWDLTMEISDERTVEFWMAIIREGDAVSQVGFVSETDLRMRQEDFGAVVRRALDRLGDLPRRGARR